MRSYVEGWIDIGNLVNMAASWCRRAAKRQGPLRLPVCWVGGLVGKRRGVPRLYHDDYEAWVRACTDAGASTSPIGE